MMAHVTYRPHYKVISGVRIPSSFSNVCFQEAVDYTRKPKSDDVFVLTYPKCGTTWIQNIALQVFRKGKEFENPRDFYKLSPFIDAFGNQGINSMPRPGVLKTHLPYNPTPYTSDAKYIIVLRNPKDCCVSLFYHTKMNVGFGFWDGEFDDFFELFMAGEVEYDDYFDHLMSWYPYRNENHIFFTTYEDMKKDTKDIVLKLARFLGQEYIEAIEKDNNALNNILHFSSFDYMKKNMTELYDSTCITDEQLNSPNMLEGMKCIAKYARSLNPPPGVKLQFVRKGIVGDWRNHFSEEQSQRLSKKFMDRTQGTEIQEMYKTYL